MTVNNKYAKTNEIIEEFIFLKEEYDFELKREENLNYGTYVDFIGNGRRVSLGFDFKDYYFYFLIFNGEDTQYRDDQYGKNIISVEDLVLQKNPKLSEEDLQPDRELGYKKALKLNAEMLRKYGDKVLKGEEWI